MSGLRDHLADILQRRDAGDTYREIALIYGVTQQRVQQVVTAVRPPTRKPGQPNMTYTPYTAAQIHHARTLWGLGYTYNEIAKVLTSREHPVTKGAIAGIAYRRDFPPRRQFTRET